MASHRFIDITGQTFDRLTAIERVERDAEPEQTFWRCRCACGAFCVVNGYRLRTGRTRSCGCLNKDVKAAMRTTHGRSKTPEYFAWSQAKARCNDPNHQAFADYGGRGIRMSDRWASDFMAFLADVGERPSPKHTLDRIDNGRGYEPGNCRWVTFTAQHNNRRRNKHLTFEGRTRTIAEWARERRLPVGAIYQRIAHGWTVERALSTGHRVRRSREG